MQGAGRPSTKRPPSVAAARGPRNEASDGHFPPANGTTPAPALPFEATYRYALQIDEASFAAALAADLLLERLHDYLTAPSETSRYLLAQQIERTLPKVHTALAAARVTPQSTGLGSVRADRQG
ncbi:MAG TPA: hypothetical protein VK066_25955 [Chloroflexota bacterium]|nr:hypothetical protein [Chloroflexota bacterium]